MRSFRFALKTAGYLVSVSLPLVLMFPGPKGHTQDLVQQHQRLMAEAIRNGKLELTGKLLETPYVDINDEVNIGSASRPVRLTYLRMALETNNRGIISILLQEGADTLWIAPDDYGGLHAGSTYLVQVICHRGGAPPIGLSNRIFDLIFWPVRFRFGKGAELAEFLNRKNAIGYTALTCLGDSTGPWDPDASEEVMLRIARYLIEGGADPNIRIGLNHLINIVRIRRPTYQRLIDYLVEHGAN